MAGDGINDALLLRQILGGYGNGTDIGYWVSGCFCCRI